MTKYQIVRPGAIALAVLCLCMCTGLAVEKVLKDGVSSYTLLAAMVVLPAAVGMLLHQGFEDLRDGKLLRAPTAIVLALLCLAVTLPASIGSSGGARDTALAEAAAANRGVEIAKESYSDVKRDLEWAKTGVRNECVGAPPVIVDNSWPKCQWWRRQLTAHETAIGRFGKELASAPAVKVADSGEQRVAWAMSAVASNWGYSVKPSDVALVWPILPPIAFELLAAFFLCAGLQRRTSPGSLVAENQPVMAIDAPKQVELPRVEVFPIAGNNPPSDPRPRKRTTKRQAKREKGVAWVRKYRERHGKAPPLGVVSNVLRVPQTTAFRWRKLAA
jgi:NADH:ubiquinone oxidoreductase subunit 6 (subunit J)